MELFKPTRKEDRLFCRLVSKEEAVMKTFGRLLMDHSLPDCRLAKSEGESVWKVLKLLGIL